MVVLSPRLRIPFLGAIAGIPGPSRGAFLTSVLAGLVAGGSSAGLLAFINNTLTEEERVDSISRATFLGLCLLMLAAGILSEILALHLTQNVLFNVRLWLSRRILSAPLRQLQTCGPHRLMAALTDDIGNIAHAYQALPVLFIEGSVALGSMIYIGCLSRTLLAILLIFLSTGLSVFFVAQSWSLRWMRRAREADDALFSHFQAVTQGCKELKMNAQRRRAFINDELSATADRIRKSVTTGLIIFILGAHSSKILFFVAIGLVLFVPTLAQDLSTHVASGWTLAILFIMAPISTIVNTVPIVGQGLVALRKIESLGFSMSQELLAEDQGGLAPIPEDPGVLEFVGVSHSYRSDPDGPEFTLGPIDLRIEPGELLFVTGGNGSGKTTMAFLLLGLFAPERGTVMLSGKPVIDDHRDAFRQNFAAVFADAFNFQALLGYYDTNSVAKAKQLLAEYKLAHKLDIRDGRFSTIDLSRGQRKRLALLAACVEDRPFYLFDEWAAEQDPTFRKFFYTTILTKLRARGKTVIVITHDDRYYHLADRILHLNAGNIEEIVSGQGRPSAARSESQPCEICAEPIESRCKP